MKTKALFVINTVTSRTSCLAFITGSSMKVLTLASMTRRIQDLAKTLTRIHVLQQIASNKQADFIPVNIAEHTVEIDHIHDVNGNVDQNAHDRHLEK